jgi:hypothetical protein
MPLVAAIELSRIIALYQGECLNGVWAVELPSVSVRTALYAGDQPQTSDVVDDKLSGDPQNACLMGEFAQEYDITFVLCNGSQAP